MDNQAAFNLFLFVAFPAFRLPGCILAFLFVDLLVAVLTVVVIGVSQAHRAVLVLSIGVMTLFTILDGIAFLPDIFPVLIIMVAVRTFGPIFL